jgi:flavorubredoxin
VTDPGLVHECAKRYYAEIMMPFRNLVRKHLDRLASYKIDVIAPSHGPMYDRPAFILEAYRDWTGDTPRNEVVIPYISMHGSTERMIAYLLTALGERGVTVRPFDLACTDIGKLAISLVDAATVVIGTPTVHGGPHPSVFFATHLANALRPKLKFAAVVGSFGWGTRAVEQIAGLIPSLKVEILDPVLVKGLPRDVDYAALDALAETIASKHRELGLK